MSGSDLDQIAHRLRWSLKTTRKLLPRAVALKEALVISGHLPWPKWYFDAARAGVYPIQTHEARQSALEIRG
jgi:hypothetical protein